ncbi:hypothetical protein [Legionella feeleii]|uniref:Uncharacterized protein n=1 Tax=Legionella feeleii TaxID=453 RepID=A0A378IWE6_9GAMM|nr:hypothetical protein [Legionella feeleii]STX38811.1 Uncharacterised protein [Legionella feeleii]
MKEFICTLVGTFLGAFLAFLFNEMRENSKKLNHEKAMLYEVLDTLKYQINYLVDLNSRFNKNYKDNKIPIFLTKDSMEIKDIAEESDLDWLKYGKLMDYFSVPTIDLEKMIFLINKRGSGGDSLLNNIRFTAAGYDQINNLFQERDRIFSSLDVFFSEHSKQDLLQVVATKSKFNDLLIFGSRITQKLIEDLRRCKDEFSECVNKIEEYIKDHYREECCLKKFCCRT